ncbi:MAG: hypothetical protein DWQ07_12880 [Chloroflexi bacterium]|nr:MAG: hypothetical protein DWQ07_12880 [Chloroflexota bacterium]MBL1196934.1 hypothetical protein [Chloroflexota bacterium]NOH14230.1 hypothetical protein [Chloroflexota bacterium]
MNHLPLEKLVPILDVLPPREAVIAFAVWRVGESPFQTIPRPFIRLAQVTDSDLDLVTAVANHLPEEPIGEETYGLLVHLVEGEPDDEFVVA